MYDKKAILWKVLINRYRGGKADTFVKYLPPEQAQQVLNLTLASKDLLPLLTQPYDALEHIHYSWFLEPLSQVEKAKLPLLLSALPEPLALKLENYFKESSRRFHPPAPLQHYLFRQYFSILQLDAVPPAAYLPQTELSPLGSLSKGQLIEIMDLLGLYDLAEEIHKIVDKHTLERIYSSLSKKQFSFLKQCLHQKEKLIAQRLKLEYWDGDPVKLKKLIHHRGILRFGYALSGEDPYFLWHVTHRLDTGRGAKLTKYYSKNPIQGVTPTIRKQVNTVLKFLNQGNPL